MQTAVILNSLQVKAGHAGAALNIAVIWSALDSGAQTGHNFFIQLAVWIHSITPNAAGAKYTFSQMGIIHTKLQNRFYAEKMHKMVMVRMDLKWVHREAQEEERACKREFTIDDPAAASDTQPGNAMETYRTGAASAAQPPTAVPTQAMSGLVSVLLKDETAEALE